LDKIINYDNITLGDAQEIYAMIERKQILDKYTFPTKPSKDGYYRIYVADATKKSGRRQLYSKNPEELRDKVYAYEKGIAGTTRKTFADVFKITQDEKIKYIKDEEKLLSVRNTMLRTESEYRRFFSDTEFERKYIDTISKTDIEGIIFQNLSKYELKKKGLASLKGILNAVFTLAFEQYWIKDNVYQRINFKKFDGMLAKEAPISERVHSDFDIKRILDTLHEHQENKPNYIPAYALEIQILMGLRRGEVPPLMWSDITDKVIRISKEQITVKKDADTPEHFEIVNHTKTHKERWFPISDSIREFLDRLQYVHDKYYPDSPYLFPAYSANGVITNNTVYNLYRRICKKLGITVSKELIKGTHSFRRSAITAVANASGGDLLMVSQIFGNSPEVAKKNYYTGADFNTALDAVNKRKFS